MSGSRAIRNLAALLAIAGFTAGCDDRSDRAERDADRPSASVSVTVVTEGSVEERLELFGTIDFDPDHVRSLTSVRSGEVLEVSVAPGRHVEEGSPMLVLGPVPEDSLEVQRARIELEFARQALERTSHLAAVHLATNQEVAEATRQLEAGRAVLGALGRGASGPLVVHAPAAGVVTELRVRRGDLVQAGQELARIAATEPMAVRIGFELEDMPRLTEGLPVLLEPVFVGENPPVVHAVLSRVQRLLDPASQLVEGIVVLENPPEWAVAGERVRAEVVLESVDAAVQVPREALVVRDGVAGVFVVDGGQARFQPVTFGVQGADFVQATSGVAVGQRLALHGRTLLSDGMAVREAP